LGIGTICFPPIEMPWYNLTFRLYIGKIVKNCQNLVEIHNK